MTEYDLIVEEFRKKALNLRAIHRLLEGSEFHSAFENEKADKELLKVILKSGDLPELKRWIKNNLPVSIEFMTYNQLKEMAKNNHVFRWSRLSREELIQALKGKDETGV